MARGIVSRGDVQAASGSVVKIGDAQLAETELEMLDGLTAGAVTASKVLVAGADKSITGLVKKVEAKTATYAVTATDSGKIFTNDGASGAFEFDLPAAVSGLHYDFVVKAAHALRIDPNGSETIALPSGVQQAAGKYVEADAVGEYIRIACVKTGEWTALGGVGTWTAEG